MKIPTLWILLVAVLTLPRLSFSQGLFIFTNYLMQGNGLDSPIFDGDGRLVEGTNYIAVLYAGLSPETLQPHSPSAPFLMAAEGRAGYFRNPTNVLVTVFEVPPNGFVWAQVRVWDLRIANTYEECAKLGIGGYGESNVLGLGSGGGFQTPPAGLAGLQSFRLRRLAGVVVRTRIMPGNQIRLDWYGSFMHYQLQQATILGQPWVNIGEATTRLSYTNAITTPQQFFRVIGLLE
jgi:hypothetical protein